MVPAARVAEDVSVAAEPTSPIRSRMAGVPNSASSAMATSATASEGPRAAMAPERNDCFKS